MAEGSDLAATLRLQPFRAGDILFWTVEPSSHIAAREKAAWMGEMADAHDLGDWGIAERGLGDGQAFFDLTLDADTDRPVIKIVFGCLPDAIY